ncbi:hypothetical protein PIB30_099456 [Stylosanthes scabra]|uniref:Uncharacterized protein n=1 Tax=Stylosanthes scabra TaxID=79078 RepID=A0ABU6QXL0_9FABA|nr:hypothetical protein [Stylosanthes scabra]
MYALALKGQTSPDLLTVFSSSLTSQSFNPRGIDTHFTVVLLDTIRYTCRDLGFTNPSISCHFAILKEPVIQSQTNNHASSGDIRIPENTNTEKIVATSIKPVHTTIEETTSKSSPHLPYPAIAKRTRKTKAIDPGIIKLLRKVEATLPLFEII